MIFHVAMGHQVLYSNRDFQENVFPPIAHFSIYPHLSGRQHEKTFCIPFWAWGITCRELLQGFIMKSNWKGALWHEMLLGDLSMPSSPTRPPSGWAGWALQGFGCLHLTSIKDPSPSCRKSRLSLEKLHPMQMLPIYFRADWIMLWMRPPLLFELLCWRALTKFR